MVSIIIPAHNEANVIRRCLEGMIWGARPDELDIIVVCNGCRDRTAELAHSCGPGIRVIETNTPSKANALNLGDEAAVAFPRFYVDADVVIGIDAIRQTTAVLEEPGVLAAAPLMEVDTGARSWSVRAFYRVWLRLPYCREALIGSGVYALSEVGRRRFDRFPIVTADDAFVRLHFTRDERRAVPGCIFTVRPPKTLSGIVDIKTRAHFGNVELRLQCPALWRNENASHGGALLRMALSPTMWPALLVYGYVKLATRYRVWKRFRNGELNKWERDESAREIGGT
ncbi:MAG: glycosyltransferase family 2 protein [Phycisphaerae bacterium]|nr:glycosyltransferase family 2 protein [Phycisphaerae bacterium]